MGLLDRVMRPFGRRATVPVPAQLDSRFEATAARLEAHTTNLAEHHAQLRDESIRQIINEVRANSSFLADSTIALDRLNARRADLAHAAVRPLVHVARAAIGIDAAVIVVDHVDPVLIDELVTDGYAVTVVDPAIDHPLPPEVVVSMVPIAQFRGPATRVPLVVWVARSRPSSANLDAVRAWMQVDGVCILACPEPIAEFTGFSIVARRDFSRTESGRFARQHDESSATGRPALFVHHLLAI